MRVATIGLAMLLAGAAGAVGAAAQQPSERPIYGVWLDHHKAVKVETESCGSSLCGKIVWATPQAREEAKEAGTDSLIGLEVLSDYHQTSAGTWEGRVFVPDMKRKFYSRIEQQGPDKLKISGCILGGLLCKSQYWTRA